MPTLKGTENHPREKITEEKSLLADGRRKKKRRSESLHGYLIFRRIAKWPFPILFPSYDFPIEFKSRA
jgi:hypothetical protein